MVMASIESSDDDVKLGTTPNNALNDMTPKENTKEELNACKVFVTEMNIKDKAPIKSSNIASLPNVTNNTKEACLMIAKASIESSDIAYVPNVAKNTKNTSANKPNNISQGVVKPILSTLISNIFPKTTQGWRSSETKQRLFSDESC